MEWKPTRFIVQSAAGSRTVTGRICAPFGIHDIGETEGCWAAVHVPSGLYLTPGAGFQFRDTAERFCERVAELADWRAIDPDAPPSDLGDMIFDAWADMRNAERQHAALPC